MIKKTSDYAFYEADSIRLIQAELEKHKRIKTYFSENDKTPNTDGYFEVLRESGEPLKRFVVQIKSAVKLRELKAGIYSYQADAAFLQYIQQKIDENPAVFFIAEMESGRVFFKHVSQEYLKTLDIGLKSSVAIHLDENDILKEDQFYDSCKEIAEQMDRNSKVFSRGKEMDAELHEVAAIKDETFVAANAPKVFISYSWSSEGYKKRVLELAIRLRCDGVDITLDQWDLRPGQDMHAFMEQSISGADKVLILCDKSYADKADKRIGGVGTETQVITPDVYGKHNQTKFIPVIMEMPKAVPLYLRSRYAVFLDKGDDEQYRNLLLAIYGKTESEKPALGTVKEDILSDKMISDGKRIVTEISLAQKHGSSGTKSTGVKVTDRKAVTNKKESVVRNEADNEAADAEKKEKQKPPVLLKGDRNYCFGRYPQDENGKREPLLWRVLDIDIKNNRALIITEKLIDCCVYNSVYRDSTWENCSLRKWLNGEFIVQAFNRSERARIAAVEIQNPDNQTYETKGGNSTIDQVFVLSIDEAEKYFMDDKDRRATVTPYAKSRGAYAESGYKLPDGEPTGWWWLRSPGIYSSYTSMVYYYGGVDRHGNLGNHDSVSVRPALWLKL